jgi:predicted phosphodiesterase
MKTTGLFTTHRVEVEVEINKPFKLIPFGDIHRDSDLHADEHWRQFLAYAKKQKNALFLGMGDYTDGVSTSERIVLANEGLHDTTRNTLKDVYKGVSKTLVNELGFMRGRMVGMLGGNHYFDFGNGDTTDHVLAAALNTKFLGVCSFIRLSFRFKGMVNRRHSLDIFAHHGKGAGTLPGSTFNTLEKMATTAMADFYLMGHDHKKGCIPSTPRLVLNSKGSDAELVVRERVPWLGRTGSFLKSYENGKVSYNVDAGRSPSTLGWIEFEITPRRNQKGDDDVIEFQIRGTA